MGFLIFLIVILAAAAILLPSLMSSPKTKGFVGEFATDKILRGIADKNAPPLSNLLLPDGRGSTQIDHVLVCSRGVFVIEVKNYQGAIYGRANDKTWTQSFGRGRTYKFQNPLRQNYPHVLAVAGILEIPKEQIYSVVAFGGLADFKKARPENVVYIGGLKDYILSKPKGQLSESDVVRKWVKLMEVNLTPDKAAKRTHLNSVRARNSEYN